MNRKMFLASLGKTLAVGLGLGLLTSEKASATTAGCETRCFPVSGSCDSACCTGSPPCPTNLFHCITDCGYDFYQCYAQSCANAFCLNGC